MIEGLDSSPISDEDAVWLERPFEMEEIREGFFRWRGIKRLVQIGILWPFFRPLGDSQRGSFSAFSGVGSFIKVLTPPSSLLSRRKIVRLRLKTSDPLTC